MLFRLSPLPSTCLLIVGLLGQARAQTDLSGPLSDSTTGPLTAGVYRVPSGISVPAGQTLTIDADVIIKFEWRASFVIQGTLDVNGEVLREVVFTSWKDDTAGGDTNGDGGATTPVWGDWRYLQIYPSAAGSDIQYAIFRYGGYGGYAPVFLHADGADITLSHCSFEHSFRGLDLHGTVSQVTVTNCSFVDNAFEAVHRAHIDSVPGFLDNTASGNGADYIEVIFADPTRDLTIGVRNYLGGALVLKDSPHIGVGMRLTLLEGVVIKMHPPAMLIDVDGGLDLLGAPDNPIVITSIRDDQSGGDTNGNGSADFPAPGDWYGISYEPVVPSACRAENVLIRYPGSSYYAGLESRTSRLSARSVRVEHSAGRGFKLSTLAIGEDLVAQDCFSHGVELGADSFEVRRVTAAFNGGAGLHAVSGFAGTVASSLAWDNQGANIDGLDPGELLYSNGSAALAGSFGNIFRDPLFVDGPARELTLRNGSPCIDAGDPTDSTRGRDFTLVSRRLDGDLAAEARVDMGAFEFSNVRLAASGNLTPGGSLIIDTTGTPGLVCLMVIGVQAGDYWLERYGGLHVDLQVSVLQPWLPTPSSVTIPLPGGLPTPRTLVLQVLARTGLAGGSPGNFSNPVSLRIE